MDYEKRELLTYQLISGILYFPYDDKRFTLVSTSSEEKYFASLEYYRFIEENRFGDFIRESDLNRLLYKTGFWTDDHQKALDQAKNSIPNLQENLYLQYNFPTRVSEISKSLQRERKKIRVLSEQQAYFSHYSLEYQASQYKHRILLSLSIRDEYNKPVCDLNNFRKVDYKLISAAMKCLLDNTVSDTDIREIARTNPWRNIWSASKENSFNQCAGSRSGNQNALIFYSQMYDNIAESLDPPNDIVLNNDDMLEGWFIVQKKEREEEKKKNNKTNKTANIRPGGYQEVMLPAKNIKEAKEVFNMNDMQGQMSIKSRDKTIKEKQEVKEQSLPDVQMRLNREIVKQAKGK